MGGKMRVVPRSEKNTKQRLQSALDTWMKDGGQGVFAPWSAVDGNKYGGKGGGGGGGKDEPDKENPPLPPVEPPTEDPASLRPASNNWPDIVKFYFPKGAGNQYKEGGLVRGGGKAQRGSGRGRIV